MSATQVSEFGSVISYNNKTTSGGYTSCISKSDELISFSFYEICFDNDFCVVFFFILFFIVYLQLDTFQYSEIELNYRSNV